MEFIYGTTPDRSHLLLCVPDERNLSINNNLASSNDAQNVVQRDDSDQHMSSCEDEDVAFGDVSEPLMREQTDIQKQDENHVTPQRYSRQERIRLIRTVSMTLFYVCLGLSAGIMSPASIDLMELYNCNVAQLGLVFMNKAIGMMAGSLFGAVISNRFRSKADLFLSLIIMLFGLTNAALPWSPDAWVAGTLMFLIGTMHGTINVVCSSVTIAEWGEKAAAPVNALHFALTVGMMLAPPTTAPFLADEDNSTFFAPDPMVEDSNLLPISNSSSFNSHVFIPFAIHGGLGICTGILFMCYYISRWEYSSAVSRIRTESGRFVPILHTQTDGCFTVKMMMALCLVYVCIVNSNTSVTTYIFYIAVRSNIGMDKTRAAFFNTLFNGSWVLGRFLGTINAKFFKIHYLVFFSVTTVLVNSILLVFYGLESEQWFWILTCALGMLSGPCYPTVLAWADRYIEMEGIMVAVVDIGIGVGGFLALYLGGYLLQTFGPVYIFIMTAAASAGLFVLMTILQISLSYRGDRFTRERLLRVAHTDDRHCHQDT